MPSLLRLLSPLLCVAVLLATPARVVAAPDLYTADAPVTGLGEAERDVAVARALAEVAGKVSADPKAIARVRSVRDPNALVSRYQYATAVDGSRVLRVTFDQRAVDELLRDSGVASWSGPRPSLLLWVGQEVDGTRVLRNLESDPELGDAARRAAAARGLPLSLPLVDLEDQERLPAQALWAGDAAVIDSASTRYAAEAVLAGVVTQRPGDSRWRGTWTLVVGGEPQSLRSEGDSAAEAVARAVDQTAGRLAAGAAPPPESLASERVRVQVRGIDSLVQQARVLRLLQSVEGVESATPRAARVDVMLFDVAARGGAEQLDRLIGVGVLEPEPVAPPVAATPGAPWSFADARLRYRVRQ